MEPKKTTPKEPSPPSKPDGKKDGGPSASRLTLPDEDYKSVREQFGADEYCYIMDAKNIGNLGRYLNVSMKRGGVICIWGGIGYFWFHTMSRDGACGALLLEF